MFFMLVALAWEEAGSVGRTKSLPVFGKSVNPAYFLSSLLSLFSVSLPPTPSLSVFFSLCLLAVCVDENNLHHSPCHWTDSTMITLPQCLKPQAQITPSFLVSVRYLKHSAQITQLPRGRDHMSLEPVPLTSRPRKASGVQPHLVDGHGTMLLQLLILTIQVLHEVFDDPLCFDGSSVVFLEIQK